MYGKTVEKAKENCQLRGEGELPAGGGRAAAYGAVQAEAAAAEAAQRDGLK